MSEQQEQLTEQQIPHRVHQEPSASPKMRFGVAVAVLGTMGIVTLLGQRLMSTETSLLRIIGLIIVGFLGLFGHEWIWVHSNALTRQRRTHFDEANILETYQPRARTHGHLFQPDPPTPAVSGDQLPNRTDSEKAAFNAARDAHYANMMDYVVRANKEQDAMEKANNAKGTDDPPSDAESGKIEISEPLEASESSESSDKKKPT
ncbi:hypothetical protein M3Y97_00206200 [Aphelenchoides bicaudatus]|nr:hypothetical protein M3Y97_00206200 [Aphelenchoides bicaudatus]